MGTLVIGAWQLPMLWLIGVALVGATVSKRLPWAAPLAALGAWVVGFGFHTATAH